MAVFSRINGLHIYSKNTNVCIPDKSGSHIYFYEH